MITFFVKDESLYAVQHESALGSEVTGPLQWLFSGASVHPSTQIEGTYVGPRPEMVTPWSTNAVEIVQNVGIDCLQRIELLTKYREGNAFDPMLQRVFHNPGQSIFELHHLPEPIQYIADVATYNQKEGLALSPEEVEYLQELSQRLGRHLTDSEVFGFSQINSEHCRHKIFNGRFIIDGSEKPASLFDLIRDTARKNPGRIVSAYKDNVAFVEGPDAIQFAPASPHEPSWFARKPIRTVISLKAETHNFPTTVEPFNGAATGSGGEIRDRMAGGIGSIPLAGTAVYMTSYSRLGPPKPWEQHIPPRPWLYQAPSEILIKASNGASDFGNKFGQPLICGSLFTFEHAENNTVQAFDKVIMMAGGVGYAIHGHSQKKPTQPGDCIVVMGGDNYRIGMGGGAVSSVATGEFHSSIELNAIQRSNPEMQKRVYNVIRALTETDQNPIVTVHDHGAGGHLNSLTELVEDQGGEVEINKLPIGDPTLSLREILGNESQERMGLVIGQKHLALLQAVSERERAPIYAVGKITGEHSFLAVDTNNGHKAIDLPLEALFGKPPRTTLVDQTIVPAYAPVTLADAIEQAIRNVLLLEAVACKDWLTNKVDRSVGGRIALQQTCGPLQLPLNNLGVVALDFEGKNGIATAIGHAPAPALIDAATGSRLAVAEALTNLIWAPIAGGLKSVSLSANWMWPCRNPGEDSRLYQAVEAMSRFAQQLGINIPTGKDSLSMTQKYADGQTVKAPGTVIVSAAAECADIRKAITPVLQPKFTSSLVYVDVSGGGFELGGSSYAQTVGSVGGLSPDVLHPGLFASAFDTIQQLIAQGMVLAGHDVSAGGLITALLEMCFVQCNLGLQIDLNALPETDITKVLFSEKPGLLLQVDDLDFVSMLLHEKGIPYYILGRPLAGGSISISHHQGQLVLNTHDMRRAWFESSHRLDAMQSGPAKADERFQNLGFQPLKFRFPKGFDGRISSIGISPLRNKPAKARAAILREKGVNGDREMAWSLYMAGFEVKDVHMSDLMSGRETLDDISFIVFTGGFSHSDVLGSARGWAGGFRYNSLAATALSRFYARTDTLSLGVCNGCQLMMHLGLIAPTDAPHPAMAHNESGKFESAFLSVNICENNSVMLHSLAGTTLGVWVAHGEGRFVLPQTMHGFGITAEYSYSTYPGNPNGSDRNAACIHSTDGRHLAMMPHLERSLLPWQWAFYPPERVNDEVSPWMEAFVNARKWVEARMG